MPPYYPGPGRVVRAEEAGGIIRTYVCSNCWDPLVEYPAPPDMEEDLAPGEHYSILRCATEGCPCRGFVSRRWIEREEVQRRAEAREKRKILQEIGIVPKPGKKTPERLLAELGF